MVHQQKSLMPDKPFFMYYAPGATHAPHHVPKEWSDKYKGRFDGGWDALREEILARQKDLGVVPSETELTARHEEIPAWQDMPDQMKPVLARQMEVYAGFLEHTDHHIGRLVDALDDLSVFEDTLVYYIIGDNGASAEGTINGTFNEMFMFNGADALELPSTSRRMSTSSARRLRTTTMPSVGRTRWTRPTSGRSRSPHTGAAHVTARSCTGLAGSRRRVRSARSSTT